MQYVKDLFNVETEKTQSQNSKTCFDVIYGMIEYIHHEF